MTGRGSDPDYADFVSDTGTGALTHVIDQDEFVWREMKIISQPGWAFIDNSGKVTTFPGTLPEKDLIKRVEALANT